MKNFILIGAAGYVAPRHLKAIKENGGNLVAALDPHDSVGILDRFFPDAKYFMDIERLDRFVELLRDRGEQIDYVSICSPNHLHDAHCRFALRINADAICEKPLTINARNIELLRNAEERTGRKINVILQLRLNEQVQKLREKLKDDFKRHYVKIKYVTPRGAWYHHSWKADEEKSGGLAANIGIHLFDIVYYIFGNTWQIKLSEKTVGKISGSLKSYRADIDFLLSIENGATPQRIFEVNGEVVDLSAGFETLHDLSYDRIIAGGGFGLADILEATKVTEKIRSLS